MTVRKRIRAHGEVQGVFFRDTIRGQAEQAGVAGWVANRHDGSVEAAFEGPEDAVDALVQAAREGSDQARVDRLDVTDEDPEGASGFDVR